jgi:hypothetical protein
MGVSYVCYCSCNVLGIVWPARFSFLFVWHGCSCDAYCFAAFCQVSGHGVRTWHVGESCGGDGERDGKSAWERGLGMGISYGWGLIGELKGRSGYTRGIIDDSK